MTQRTEFMLTTIDNPYNPFTQFDDWFGFDAFMGYNSCDYLARMTISSDDLSERDQDLAVAEAAQAIVVLNVTGMHRLVDRYNDPVVLTTDDLPPTPAPDLVDQEFNSTPISIED